MRVLVTGANGHIGTNLLPLLLEEGHDVVPFVRERSDTEGIDSLGLPYARGDVLDKASLERAADGCEAIIHMAAVYSWSNDPAVVMAPAIEGTRNVMDVARTRGIRRVVYTSSTVAVGVASEASVRDESHWTPDGAGPYSIAKRDSEREAARLAEEAGIELVILNPTGVYGRGDYRITPTNWSVVQWLRGLSQTVTGGLAVVDARDVALAHVRALTRGRVGERHIISAVNLSFRDLGRALKERYGTGPLHLPLPRAAVIPWAAVIELCFRAFGAREPFTRTQAREFTGRWAWYDGSKAERELGIEYHSLDDTLDDTVSWLAHRGELSTKLNARLREQLPFAG